MTEIDAVFSHPYFWLACGFLATGWFSFTLGASGAGLLGWWVGEAHGGAAGVIFFIVGALLALAGGYLRWITSRRTHPLQ